MTIEKIIENLIATGKEDNYYDFKREKHKDKAELVHDIICLANSSSHKGDRFLVFGVENNYTPVGIPLKDKQTQIHIIDTLRNARFAGGVFPDIQLEPIQLSNKNIEVLIIKDKPNERPYYLEKEYYDHKLKDSKGKPTGCIVRAGTTYIRTRDGNTPIDRVASTVAIEKIWRQRFGLDLTPLEKMTQYLLDFKGWCQPLVNIEWNSCSTPSHLLSESGHMYYRQAPEFTIRKSPLYGYDDSGLGDKVQHGESWVRHAPDPDSRMYKVELVYHQTILHTEEVLTYDGSELFNNPKTYSKLKNFENALFYYYLADDILKFNILQFLHSTSLNYTSEIINPRRDNIVPLVIFKNENELEEFCNYLDSSFNVSSIKNIPFYQDRAYDWENKPHDILNIQLCLFIKEKLPEWRSSHISKRI